MSQPALGLEAVPQTAVDEVVELLAILPKANHFSPGPKTSWGYFLYQFTF